MRDPSKKKTIEGGLPRPTSIIAFYIARPWRDASSITPHKRGTLAVRPLKEWCRASVTDFLTKAGFVSNCYDPDVTRRIIMRLLEPGGLLDSDWFHNSFCAPMICTKDEITSLVLS